MQAQLATIDAALSPFSIPSVNYCSSLFSNCHVKCVLCLYTIVPTCKRLWPWSILFHWILDFGLSTISLMCLFLWEDFWGTFCPLVFLELALCVSICLSPKIASCSLVVFSGLPSLISHVSPCYNCCILERSTYSTSLYKGLRHTFDFVDNIHTVLVLHWYQFCEILQEKAFVFDILKLIVVDFFNTNKPSWLGKTYKCFINGYHSCVHEFREVHWLYGDRHWLHGNRKFITS